MTDFSIEKVSKYEEREDYENLLRYLENCLSGIDFCSEFFENEVGKNNRIKEIEGIIQETKQKMGKLVLLHVVNATEGLFLPDIQAHRSEKTNFTSKKKLTFSYYQNTSKQTTKDFLKRIDYMPNSDQRNIISIVNNDNSNANPTSLRQFIEEVSCTFDDLFLIDKLSLVNQYIQKNYQEIPLDSPVIEVKKLIESRIIFLQNSYRLFSINELEKYKMYLTEQKEALRNEQVIHLQCPQNQNLDRLIQLNRSQIKYITLIEQSKQLQNINDLAEWESSIKMVMLEIYHKKTRPWLISHIKKCCSNSQNEQVQRVLNECIDIVQSMQNQNSKFTDDNNSGAVPVIA